MEKKLPNSWFYIALVLISGVHAVILIDFVAIEGLSSFADDSMSYLVMAQYLSPWYETNPAIIHAWPDEQYPPLFPIFLALTGASQNFQLAHLLVALTYSLMAIVFALWIRKKFQSATLSLLLTFALLVSFNSWIHTTRILSEHLFMFLLLLALILYENSDNSIRKHTLFGFLVGLIILTRSLGFALLLAYIILELLQWLKKRNSLTNLMAGTVSTILTIFPWYLLRSTPGAQRYSQDLSSFINSISDDGLFSLLQPQLEILDQAWFGQWVANWTEGFNVFFIILIFLTVILLTGWIRGIVQKQLYAWFAIIYLAVLIAWPYPGQMTRFIYVLTPITLVMAVEGIQFLLRRFPIHDNTAHHTTLLLPALLLTLSLPSLGFLYGRAHFPQDEIPYNRITEFYLPSNPEKAIINAETQLVMFSNMQKLRKELPRNSRVMSLEPGYIALLAGIEGIRLPLNLSNKELNNYVYNSNVEYVYLSRIHPRYTGEDFDGTKLQSKFLAYSRKVWSYRSINNRATLSILLKLDRQKLADLIKTNTK